MKFLPLMLANLWRKRTRTVFTLLSVVAAFLLFGLLGALRQAFEGGVDLTGQDRLITMSRVSLVEALPISYRERILSVEGVEQVTYEDWFGAYLRDPSQPIVAFAVDPASYLDVYSEFRMPDEQRQRFLRDRRGALVGVDLMREYGWKLGQRLPLRSNIWRDRNGDNTWEVTIDGVYDTARRGGNTNQLLLHYTYFDEGRAFRKNTVGIFIVRIADPEQSAVIAHQIDTMFSNSPDETKTATEKAFVQSFAAQFGDIGAIVTAIVTAVFFSMLLVTANTMGQSVRERTAELAVLKSLGFSNLRVAGMVVAESLLISVTGGTLGLALAWVVSDGLQTRLIQFLPSFYLPAADFALGVLLIAVLGLLAAALPALQALRLQVASALRRA
ncbi:MAG: ABC transporter permease [Gammaproteobacteria bacterium]|jgi:putative ABC transport system permease protein